jgi:hypothetical protein
MTAKKQLEQLRPFEARTIIEELRKGSVPADYVSFFTVGRENWLTFVTDDLTHYIAEGGAKVRFVSGDYGDGKTHFMSLIAESALEKGFAVSFAVLTREVPIHRFESVYQALAGQLRGGFEGIGIRTLMDIWSRTLLEIGDLPEILRNLPGMNINFANALIALMENRMMPLAEGETQEQRLAAREILYHWFEGGKISKKDLRPFGIFEVLNKTNSKHFLNSLIAFLRHLNHKGLVLLTDELETVMAMSVSVRNAAYENVRLLIDNTEQAEFLHIFFSIIPDVLLSEKGFKSYDALWSRVRSVGEGKGLNWRGVLIDLHRTPLSKEELMELGGMLRRIHGNSYRWEGGAKVKAELIEKIFENQKRMGLLSDVRLFIKQVIRVLDMTEQGQNPDEIDLTEQIVLSRQEQEKEKPDA